MSNADYSTYRFTLTGTITVPLSALEYRLPGLEDRISGLQLEGVILTAYPALELRNGPEGEETYHDATFEQLKALGVDYELEDCLLERNYA